MAKLFRLLILVILCCSATAWVSTHESALNIESLFADALKEDKIFWPLVLALLAGFLTSLSPCVYPLIPITLSIIGTRTYESRLHGFLTASSYVLGMSTTYTALGALFASLGMLIGSFMQSEAFLIIFGLIFLFMALAMLGVFEIALPPGLLKRLSRIGGHGFKGAFLMGLVAGIIAAPCTGPVLGAILAVIAHDQNLNFGIFLMASFSLGLGLPFLALGTFSSTLAHLPKSGPWMEIIKYLLGALLLSMSIYFLAQVLSPLHEMLLRLAYIPHLLIFLVIAIGVLIISQASQRKIWRALGALLCSVGFATLPIEQKPPTQHDESQWHIIDAQSQNPQIFDQLLNTAQQRGLPVLIDFYADWCISCRELSNVTFVDPAVRARLKQFFLIKIDASQNSSLLSSLHQKYGITGLPTIVIIDRDGQEKPSSRIMGFIKAKPFLKALMPY
jgi:thiol:disulfide interchange protein DsbD